MNFYDNAAAVRTKIEDALADKNLVLSIRETYPITMIISQSQAPEDQLSLLVGDEEDTSSTDASLRFIFDLDGLKIRTSSRLVITDAFMTKLRGLAKKWHTAYCHAFFAERCLEEKARATIAEYAEYREVAPDPDDFPEELVDPFEEFMDEAEE